MKTWMPIASTLLGAWLAGCGAQRVVGVEPTDLSKLEVGAPRSEVEEVFGPPIESHVIEGRASYIYEYEPGSEPSPGPYTADPIANLGVTILMWTVPIEDEHEGYVVVSYSPDGKIINYAVNLDKMAALERMTVLETQCPLPFSEAVLWDADAQWTLAKTCPNPIGQVWLCLAAHRGHLYAQSRLASFYRYGLSGQDQSFIQAYKWYQLAASKNSKPASADLEIMSKNMTPSQITEAKRLVAEWEPNPAECEADAAKFEN